MKNFAFESFLIGKKRRLPSIKLVLIFFIACFMKVSATEGYLATWNEQERTITGTVTNPIGEPVPGVTVMVKGTTTGTVTGEDGKYSLAVPPDAGILRFSFVGMQEQEIAIESRTNIDVVMEDTTIGMDEIVVVGYGEQTRATLTGSATTVTGESILDMPNISLAQRLEGQAAGVRVSQISSMTGASAAIRIRGSLAEPLYVIDDVVVDKRDFDALTADEVESINIMKDAATSSIYGARAADGVVVVRTKRGQFNQEARFNYLGSFNAQVLPSNYQDFVHDWDVYMYKQAMREGMGDPGLTDAEKEWLAANPDFKGWGSAFDHAWQRPHGQEHRISAQGGSANTAYYASFGSQNVFSGSGAGSQEKYNFRTSIRTSLHENFTLEWIADGFVEEGSRPFAPYGIDGGATDEAVSGWFQVMHWPPEIPFAVVVDELAGTGRVALPEDRGTEGHMMANQTFQLMDQRNTGYRENTWRRFNNRVNLDWDLSSLTEGLSASFAGNYSFNSRQLRTYAPYITFYEPTRVSADNRFVFHDDLSRWVYRDKFAVNMGIPNKEQHESLTNRYQVNTFLNYVRSFGDHNITAVGFFEYAGSYTRSISGGRQHPRIDGVDQFFNYSGARDDTWFSGSEGQYARASFAGRVNYNYEGKYIAEFSFRNDASYLFPEDTRWGFFPSISAAWRIDQEDFFNVFWINSLKPRVSYGTSGSEGGIAPFQFQSTYSIAGGRIYGSGPAPGLQSNVLPNPNITWATTEAINIGLDFGLFENQVFGGIDVFKRWNTDILGARIQQFPTTWGASLPPVNYGATEMQGVELFLNHRNRVGAFTYSLGGNVSYAIDKVTIVDESPEVAGTWRSAVGRPAAQVWGYRVVTLITDQATIDNLDPGFRQFGRVPEVGDLLLKDIRGVGFEEGADGRIDGYDNDRLSENGSPRIVYGFNMGGAWRGFSLDMHWSGVGAFDKMYSEAWGPGAIWRAPQINKVRWHPDLNPDGWAPALRQDLWGRPERGHGATDIWMFNASYLRLKNVTFAYQLPRELMQGFGIDQVRLFVSGTDLLTISAWKFGDPESPNASSYPRLSTLSGGLTVNF